MKTDSFIFYRSFYEAIKEIPDDERLKVYDAICEYALNHTDTANTAISKGMMTLITPQLDANFKRRVNGSLGGRPKAAQSNEELEDKAGNQGEKQNLDETKNKPNKNQEITIDKPNVNVNDNVNVNVNVNNKTRFVKPSVDEIKAYCDSRQNDIDPEEFIDFYQSKNWFVGKNKMVDWKAAIRTWERNRINKNKKHDPDQLPTYDTATNKKLSNTELEELLSLRKN